MPLRKTKRPLYERIGLTREEYYNNDILKPHERDFVRRFSRLGEEMRWVKRDCKIAPSGIGYLPTNDFIWRGREWELKKPKVKKYNNIFKMMKRSTRQGKKNFMIDLGDSTLFMNLILQLETYNQRNPLYPIDRLYVVDRNSVTKIILRKK